MTLGPYVHESAIKLSGIHSGKVLLPATKKAMQIRGADTMFSR